MAKKYYIWNDPSCKGINIAWKELSGKEFLAMVKRPENKGRWFIRLGNEVCPDADIIILEVTEAEYDAWKQEKNAGDYLRRQSKDTSITSLDCPPQESELESLYETVADEKVDVERAALFHLAHETLELALKSLSDDEADLMAKIYVKGNTPAEIARELGVHRSTITRRVDTALNKLKKFF